MASETKYSWGYIQRERPFLARITSGSVRFLWYKGLMRVIVIARIVHRANLWEVPMTEEEKQQTAENKYCECGCLI